MQQQTIRDRLWLWAMRTNILQKGGQKGEGWADSTMTVEAAIARSGVTNVMMCGGLPPTAESLALMPSAKRIITKWGIHDSSALDGSGAVLAYDKAYNAMMQAKEIAATDPRIEAYLLDDFSTGSVGAGVKPEHIAELQRANANFGPQLPLMATMYTMSLNEPEIPGLLPFFAGYLTPLWHAADIDKLEAGVDQLADMSGGKPQLLCIYLWDFGNGKLLSYDLMQRQLDVSESLIRQDKVFGVVVLGQCMMDLDWDSCRCFYDWLDKVGDSTV